MRLQKKKEILPFVTAWMDLENIMLSKISHSINFDVIKLKLVGDSLFK